MKITGTGLPGTVYQPAKGVGSPEAAAGANRPGAAKGSGATRVSVSRDAAWIADLRAEARAMPAVRADVVEQTRASLQDGTFESGVDLAAVVDALLADL